MYHILTSNLSIKCQLQVTNFLTSNLTVKYQSTGIFNILTSNVRIKYQNIANMQL